MAERVVIKVNGQFVPADRYEVHRDGTWHWCVHLLATSGGLVYLQRRAAHLARNPDRWESTVAGHITSEDAATDQALTINERAGQVALMHEVLEEVAVEWDLRRAQYLGDAQGTNSGGGDL